MTLPEMTREVQKALGLNPDGQVGPETMGAIYRVIIKKEPVNFSPADITVVDSRSEMNIQTLHPRVRPLARSLIHMAAQQGITIKVISGTRTHAQQDVLYLQGRGKPGPIVTKARGGFSNHNFGIAFDIGIFENGNYIPESPLYKVVGSIGKSLGLQWGGDWKSIVDEPHFELRPHWGEKLGESEMLAELRERHRSGEDAFA